MSIEVVGRCGNREQQKVKRHAWKLFRINIKKKDPGNGVFLFTCCMFAADYWIVPVVVTDQQTI